MSLISTKNTHNVRERPQYCSIRALPVYDISFLHPKITVRVPQVLRVWRHWSSGKHLSPLRKRNRLPHFSAVCDERPPDHQNVFYLLTSWTWSCRRPTLGWCRMQWRTICTQFPLHIRREPCLKLCRNSYKPCAFLYVTSLLVWWNYCRIAPPCHWRYSVCALR
jgi:hypothetical protein